MMLDLNSFSCLKTDMYPHVLPVYETFYIFEDHFLFRTRRKRKKMKIDQSLWKLNWKISKQSLRH